MKQSRGTVIPHAMKLRVYTRDRGCIGFGRLPEPCVGGLEADHVRASHGVSLKSVTCDCNLVSLCASHHRYKTEHGKQVRPILLDYLAQFGYDEHAPDHIFEEPHPHVELVEGCADCRDIRARLA
jgi:hypothetical protein